jgi:hypothetical protein
LRPVPQFLTSAGYLKDAVEQNRRCIQRQRAEIVRIKAICGVPTRFRVRCGLVYWGGLSSVASRRSLSPFEFSRENVVALSQKGREPENENENHTYRHMGVVRRSSHAGYRNAKEIRDKTNLYGFPSPLLDWSSHSLALTGSGDLS